MGKQEEKMIEKRNFKIQYSILIFILFILFLRTGNGGFLGGYRTAFVLTNSMEPAIPTASLLVEKRYTVKMNLNIGDIITYTVKSGDSRIRVTHRIVAINNDGIYTKGDANTDRDFWIVKKNQVEAKVIYVMPHISTFFIALIIAFITQKVYNKNVVCRCEGSG